MPTLQVYSNAASDVFPGGISRVPCQFETSVNSGQACEASDVTIGISRIGCAR